MKIISRKLLMKMPVGTIFSYYEPCMFNGLYSLGGSSEIDFTMQSIIANIKADDTGDYIDNCTRMEKGESVGLDFDSYGREGLFEDKQLYAVYEDEDIKQLINFLVAGRF